MNERQQYGFNEFHRGYSGGKRHAARTIMAALKEMPFGFLSIEAITKVCFDDLDLTHDDLKEEEE
jgi:hypothetical protein